MKFSISSHVLEVCVENCTEGRCVNEQAETDWIFYAAHALAAFYFLTSLRDGIIWLFPPLIREFSLLPFPTHL